MSTTLAQSARRGGFVVRIVFVAYTGAGALLGVAATVLGLVAAWWLSYAAGGSRTPAPHLFYVPIILAAVRFPWPAAVVTAVAAGLLAGPALPADAASAAAQPLEGWLLRTLAFTVIGIFVASLMRGRREPLQAGVQDSLTSARLIRAVQRHQIEVFYQPLFRLEDMQVIGFEALARWADPRRGPSAHRMPGEFIPAAERTGAIAVLDGYVLRTATAQARRWGTELGPVKVSVNVSATRFKQPDLADDVARALARCGLAPQALQIEVTESALIEDLPAAVQQVNQLRRLGVRVAIDDFGAGHASLGYLDHFEVDTVKLDRSFVLRATTHPRARRLLTGATRLLSDLGVDVVAEGVETAEQAALLREAGVQCGQGFHLARPMPTAEMERLLHGTLQPR